MAVTRVNETNEKKKSSSDSPKKKPGDQNLLHQSSMKLTLNYDEQSVSIDMVQWAFHYFATSRLGRFGFGFGSAKGTVRFATDR